MHPMHIINERSKYQLPSPSFFIDKIPVFGQRILAPMDGISDHPFRSICRQMGSAASITEFINIQDVLNHSPDIQKKIFFTEEECPIGFQLFGSDAEQISLCAEKLLPCKPDFFDLNFGCSVRHVKSSGSGSSLLTQPERIKEIVLKIKSRLNLPITAKIRLGRDQSNKNYLEICRILEDTGISMIFVHGRTGADSWNKSAEWEPIGEIKNLATIPVVGNGDIRNSDDVHRMMMLTGCDAVMIGRASIGNPWIFSNIDKQKLIKKEILGVINNHWERMISFYGFMTANRIFRKHLKAYLTHPAFSSDAVRKVVSGDYPMLSIGDL